MKAEKMKIFVTAKENFISMDLDANKRTFHLKQSLHILHGFTATVLQILYILFDANTPREYMNSILNSTIGILCHLAYWSVIFKTTSIYNFIDRCETIINGSRFENMSNLMSIFMLFLVDGKMFIFCIFQD